MRSTRLLAVSILFVLSSTSQATLLWSLDFDDATGIIETTGTLDANGFGGGTITSFTMLSSTNADFPVAQYSAFGGLSYEPLETGAPATLNAFSLRLETIVEIQTQVFDLPVTVPQTQVFRLNENGPLTNGGFVAGFAVDFQGCGASIRGALESATPITTQFCLGLHEMSASAGLGLPTEKLTAVPEPGSLALLGLGALGLMRRAKSKHCSLEPGILKA